MSADQHLMIRFLGAAGTVTGSKHLIEIGDRCVLLDCGLFQGLKRLRERNWHAPPLDLDRLDGIVLSHAHIDHTGYLPALVRHGYRGPVYCTAATADLLGVMLPDSAHLQEEQAEHARRYGYSKHRPPLPLYTREDAAEALTLLEPKGYDAAFPVGERARVTYRRAGHIMGSASIAAEIDGTPPVTIAFSGDLGRWDRPIIHDPDPIPHADCLLLESTYGNREHPARPWEALAGVVRRSAERGGALVIPAFALGRTQELLWRLRNLETEGEIPVLPVYVDSPMAINVTDIYRRHPVEHDLEMTALLTEGESPLETQRLSRTRKASESKALHDVRGPIVIISASGMATGGRVLHHLKRRLPDTRTTVLLVGFQAAGTRGRSLQEGARRLRIHGREIPVRAGIETLDGLSAHADRHEILRWLDGFERPPNDTYLVHGEPEAAKTLAATLTEQRGWRARPASDGERVPV